MTTPRPGQDPVEIPWQADPVGCTRTAGVFDDDRLLARRDEAELVAPTSRTGKRDKAPEVDG